MDKVFSIISIVLASSVMQSHANLIALEQEEMTQAIGQGAAELNWTLSLNHEYANNLDLQDISKMENSLVTEAYYNYQCVNETACRFALAANNHTDQDGNKKWLVFKQFQGTLQIDKFVVEGETIKNQFNLPQTAMRISFEDAHPLKIRNLGFASVSVETGNETVKDGAEGFNNYKVYDTFTVKDKNDTDVVVNVPGFDHGQEQGFMGVNIHGNLHIDGALKIFSFNCSGAAGSRC